MTLRSIIIAMLLLAGTAAAAAEPELSPVERARRQLDAEAASGRGPRPGAYSGRPAAQSLPPAPVKPVGKAALPPL